MGLTKENGKLLLGEPKNAKDLSDFTSEATRENVLEALKWAASKATPDDLVIFGFFGQGGPMGDSGDRRCYFTSDSTFLGRDKNAIASSDLADTLKTLKSGFCPPYAYKPLIDLIFFEIQHVRPPQPTAAVRAAEPGTPG